MRKCPPSLSATLVRYLAFVRPYVALLTHFALGPRPSALARSHLFCSMGDPLDTQDFTNAVAAATSPPVHEGGIGVRLTLRSLRHFESAILNSDWLRPHLVQHRSTVGDLLADLQAGHTTDVADGHYGVVTHRLPHLRMHDVTGYIAVSTVVHRWWGLVPDQPLDVLPPGHALAVAHAPVDPALAPQPSLDPSWLANAVLSRLTPAIYAAARESAAEAAASLARTFLPGAKALPPASPSDHDWPPPTVATLSALRAFLGDPNARFKSREQALAVQHACEGGGNLLLVTPTGSGKSLAYLLPSFVDRRGGRGRVTLVVAPFVHLCRQVSSLASSAGLSSLVWEPTLSLGDVLALDCLACTPDALATEGLWEALRGLASLNSLARVVVDEAHHVLRSASFRPAFEGLSRLRELPVPLLLLTATLPPRSVAPLLASLSVTACPVLRLPSSRPRLRLSVTRLHGREESWAVEFVRHLELRRAILLEGERGVVFCARVDEVEMLAVLAPWAVKCHAQMSREDQARSLDAFLSPVHPSNVVLATSLLGNGLNLPRVRFVLHYGAPRSVCDYLQESGRAGREGGIADAEVFPCLSPDGQVLMPATDDDDDAREVLNWLSADDVCRRWALAVANDGRGETCTSLPSAVLCDACERQVAALDGLAGAPPLAPTVDVAPIVVDPVQPVDPVQAPHVDPPAPLELPQDVDLPLAPLAPPVQPQPPLGPNMDVLVDRRVHLGRHVDAAAERAALTRVLDALLDGDLCVACWCQGRVGHCQRLSCLSDNFFAEPEFQAFKRLLVLPTAHCWYCGFPQVSARALVPPLPRRD